MTAADRTKMRGRDGTLLFFGLLLSTIGYLMASARVIVIDRDVTTTAAQRVLVDANIRSALTQRTADAITAQLVGPTIARELAAYGLDVRRDLQPVAAKLVDTPEFAASYAEAVGRVHDRVFVDPTTPTPMDVSALVARARTEAISINPAYRQLMPERATLIVQLPLDSLPDLSVVGRALSPTLTLLALVFGLMATTIAIARGPRSRTLRLTAAWTFCVGGLQVAVVAAAARSVDRYASGDALPIARAVADAVLPRLVLPALVLIVVGVGMRAVALRCDHVASVRLARNGRDAFLNDENGQPVEWSFDAAYQPEVLRTAPATATFRR